MSLGHVVRKQTPKDLKDEKRGGTSLHHEKRGGRFTVPRKVSGGPT